MISFYPVEHWTQELLTSNDDGGRLLCDYYGKSNCFTFPNGRTALDILLASLHLRREDEIWIVTTFDLPNVSSCVTSTVFNHCKPSRVLTQHTKAILVIHEFGVPHPDLIRLSHLAKERGLLLIEDCAHTMDSVADGVLVGTVGDWTLLSFPKIFPVRTGGALLGKSVDYTLSHLEQEKIRANMQQVSYHLPHLSEYSKMRRQVFQSLANLVMEIGLQPYYKINEEIAPWFFPMETPHWQEYLELAPEQGIDCARWHGAKIVIFPCHQFLTSDAIGQIANFIRSIEEAKK